MREVAMKGPGRELPGSRWSALASACLGGARGSHRVETGTLHPDARA